MKHVSTFGQPWLLVCFVLLGVLLQSTRLQAAEAEPSKSSDKAFVVGTFSFVQDISQPSRPAILVRQALAEHGLEMALRYFPGKRLMVQLNRGVIDGDLSRYADLSRGFENIVRVEEPVEHACVLLYRLDGQPTYSLADEENGPRIGLYAGSPGVAAKLQERWPLINPVTYKNLSQGAGMLQSGRLDYVAIPAVQARDLEALAERKLTLEDGISLGEGYLHLHRQHEALAVAMADTLRRLKAENPVEPCNLAELLSSAPQQTVE